MIKFTQIPNLGCHGIPERCFKYKGFPMPFCSRCLGAGIGHILSFVLFMIDLLPSLGACFVLILLMLIDWSMQQFLGIMSNNPRRLITGILGGLGVGSIIWKIFSFLFNLVYQWFFIGIIPH